MGSHGDPTQHLFDPDGMQQILAQLDAYNTAFPPTRHQHQHQHHEQHPHHGQQHEPQDRQHGHHAAAHAQFGQLAGPGGSRQATMNGWAGGRTVAHLEPPAFAQEQFAIAAGFAGSGPRPQAPVITEFGGAFAPPMGAGPDALQHPQTQGGGLPQLTSTDAQQIGAQAAMMNGGQGYAIRPKDVASVPATSLAHHPADLDAWRQRLFDVDEMIILTREQ